MDPLKKLIEQAKQLQPTDRPNLQRSIEQIAAASSQFAKKDKRLRDAGKDRGQLFFIKVWI